ncbi:MAG: hypothetical protein U9Q83_02645 [Bacteroidota bacterium]|nr:hypothetical protein [Bacteroidota bacterium]
MQKKGEKYEWRQQIFRAVKPYFREKFAKFTHHKYSEDWHFRGLAFVRDDMTYVFGYNIGFFRKDKSLPDYQYDYVGCNVLVRTNGINAPLRNKYKNFFEKLLFNWISENEEKYTSFRGGIGIEFPRIAKINSFSNDKEMISYIENGILELNDIWPSIAANQDHIFTNVVKGTPPWDESILELALVKGVNTQKP